jgi:hypothetical protein
VGWERGKAHPIKVAGRSPAPVGIVPARLVHVSRESRNRAVAIRCPEGVRVVGHVSNVPRDKDGAE